MTERTPYVAKAFGWQGIVLASNQREALGLLKGLASSASLLRSDVTSCQRATDKDIAWHRAMGGEVR